MLEEVLPEGASVVLMQQTGSFMYDLNIASSDKDYKVIFMTRPRQMLSFSPPRTFIQHHVNRGFAADKGGEVEYHMEELGVLVEELAKGNPSGVELLFSEKDAVRHPVFEELRRVRGLFLTMRCARQYLGFASDAVKKLKRKLSEAGPVAERAAEFSKLLYYAHHKMLELRRILRGDAPMVALVGQERDKVLGLRNWRAGSADEVQRHYDEAEAERKALCQELDKADAEGRLPQEVDTEALLAWLRGLRLQSLIGG